MPINFESLKPVKAKTRIFSVKTPFTRQVEKYKESPKTKRVKAPSRPQYDLEAMLIQRLPDRIPGEYKADAHSRRLDVLLDSAVESYSDNKIKQVSRHLASLSRLPGNRAIKILNKLMSLDKYTARIAGNKDSRYLQQLIPIINKLNPKQKTMLTNLTAVLHPPPPPPPPGFTPQPPRSPEPEAVRNAFRVKQYENLKVLKGVGFKFQQSLQNLYGSMNASQTIRKLVTRNVLTDKELILSLMMEPVSNTNKPSVRELIRQASLIPSIRPKTFMEDHDTIRSALKKPLNETEQDLVAKVNPVFDNLPDHYKNLITTIFTETTPRLKFVNNGQTIKNRRVTLPYTKKLDQYNAGAHFYRGGIAFPRKIAIVSALKKMSENPSKIYRGFTETPETVEGLAYEVKDFEKMFPENSSGVFHTTGISPRAARVFTHNFRNAMMTLKKNNNNHLDSAILDGADISFTWDNGDTHDITWRQTKFYLNRTTNELTGTYEIADSITAERQHKVRPSQEKTIRNCAHHLIKAFFKANNMPEPRMQVGEVAHTNNQVNGYCTSLATYQMVEQLPSDPSAVRLKKDKDGKVVYDTENHEKFIVYLKDSILQAGRILPHITGIAGYIKDLDKFHNDLISEYRAIRMDGINTVEGNIRDHYETLPHAKAWEKNIDAAKKEYSESLSLQALFNTPDDYAKAKINHWRLSLVKIGDDYCVLDRREIQRLTSKEKIDEQIQSFRESLMNGAPNRIDENLLKKRYIKKWKH